MPTELPSSDLLLPIEVGAALRDDHLGMQRDDAGADNISQKNDSYCEMTAVYWAWKNLDADYYGLFHYRRYLMFNGEVHDLSDQRAAGDPVRPFMTLQSALDQIGLGAQQHARQLIESADLILPFPQDINTYGDFTAIYDQYAAAHRIQDLDDTLSYVSTRYPEIAAFNRVLMEPFGYFSNMFIMSRALFQQYCEFMFDVLEHFEQTHDISKYNQRQSRVIGYLAERLTNIFAQYVQSLGAYRCRELQTAFITRTEPDQRLEPASRRENVAIALAANDYYVPYVSAVIHSISESSTAHHAYDIIVFHQDIRGDNMRLLKAEFDGCSNIRIRFFDMAPYIDQYKDLFVYGQFSVETYFRFFLPEVMAEYDKVLYLDSDVTVMKDVAALFSTDVSGYLAAAVRDIDFAGVYASNDFPSEDTVQPSRQAYARDVLELKDPYSYFQAGVMLMNLAEIRKTLKTEEMLQVARAHQYLYLDQDVLNMAFQGRIKLIDMRWNVLFDWNHQRIQNIFRKAPTAYFKEYMASRQDPFIVHFGGTLKPWHQADCDFATDFWRFARQSVFYEVILARMSDWSQTADNNALRDDLRDEILPMIGARPILASEARKVVNKVAPPASLARKPVTAAATVIRRALRS